MSDPTAAEIEMKEKYLKFDWKDHRWQTYYTGLYPPPRTAAILTKYKKKWYKNNVDSNLDLDWDPDSQPVRKRVNTPGYDGFYRPRAGAAYEREGISISPSDASFLFCAYLALIAGGVLTTMMFPTKRDLFFLGQLSVCLMDISTHFGFKFDKGHLAKILADESGHLLVMLVAYVFINVPVVSTLIMYPLLSTNLMAAGQLAKSYELPRVPSMVSNRIRGFADPSRKFPLLQARANLEIAICAILIVLSIAKYFSATVASVASGVSLFAAFFNLNLVYTRYTIDPFTQAGLRKVESIIMRVIGGTPLEKVYNTLKKFMSSGLSKLIG